MGNENGLLSASIFYSKALMEVAASDKSLSPIQKTMFRLGANLHRMHKDGTMKLLGFLSRTVDDAWLNGIVIDQYVDEASLQLAYQSILQRAKNSILGGDLVVCNLVSLIQVNELEKVCEWCNSDSDNGYAEILDSLVVKREDARRWLEACKVPVPEFLRDISLEAGAPDSADAEAVEESIGKRIRQRNFELKKDHCQARLKALAGEFKRDISTIKKHLYGKKAKELAQIEDAERTRKHGSNR